MATKIGVIITDNKNKVLMLKEKIKKNPIPLWNIIKGTYGDEGVENIFETAIRECKEEAGVDVDLMFSLGCYISQKKEKTSTIITFEAIIKNGSPHLAKKREQLSRDECISEMRWFSNDELKKMKKEEFISNRIYSIIQDWLDDKKYPLNIIKQVEM